MTKVAAPGLPYTVWWVVFNNPEACWDPCNADDLMVPEIEASVYYGTGVISSSDGNGGGLFNATFHLAAGSVAEGACCFGALRRDNGFGAEVRLVVNEHPDFDASYAVELTTPEVNHRAVVFPPVAPENESAGAQLL